MKKKFTFIDLFAGVGGFRLGVQTMGARCVFSSEWDVHAHKTYHANFWDTPAGDITLAQTQALIPADFDMLCAGFPCQAFSIAGEQKGFADARGTLFFEVLKIAAKHRPSVLFLENVKNLVTHDKGRSFKLIKESIEALGYHLFFKVMNLKDYTNLPQNRERVYMVAFLKEKVRGWEDFRFPVAVDFKNNFRRHLEHRQQAQKYYYPPTHRYYPLLESITKESVYQWRRVYVRENKSGLCPTLTANMGGGGHNVPIIRDDFGIRKLTPRECFNLQGFHSSFALEGSSDTQYYKQAGNAVSPSMIELIMMGISEILNQQTWN